MWLCSYNTENGNYHLLSLLCGRQCSKHFTSANIHESESHSVLSNSLQPHGLYSPWNSSGQNTGVGSLSLLQGNLPHPGIEPRSPALQVDSLPAEPPRKPENQFHIINIPVYCDLGLLIRCGDFFFPQEKMESVYKTQYGCIKPSQWLCYQSPENASPNRRFRSHSCLLHGSLGPFRISL